MPEWYDIDCFFSHNIAFLDSTSFDGFAALNNKDKQFFKQRMGRFYIWKLRFYLKLTCSTIFSIDKAIANKKGKSGKKTAAKKRPLSNVESSVPCAIDDFKVGYTNKHSDVCRWCYKAIGNTKKPNVVVQKKIRENGNETLLYHKHCFTKQPKMLGWFYDAEKLKGFKSLKKKDRDYLIPKLQ